jgi:hypothetical protein
VKYVADNQIIGWLGHDKIFDDPPHSLSPIVHRLSVCSLRPAIFQRPQLVAKNASLSAAHSHVNVAGDVSFRRWWVLQFCCDWLQLLLPWLLAVDSWKWFRHYHLSVARNGWP